MKFMRLGTRPDNFYTEEAIRTVLSDLPSDLTIRVNNITYLLHKLQFPLVPKCGLLQRLCSDRGDCSRLTLELHDIPGGEDAFELCAKFCYGITIDLSAHNFVPAICAAKFLQMTESIEKGNFVSKLEMFFHSCILEGWKDSIVTLQTTGKLPEWSENLGIIRKCIDSIVEKILTPPTKVRWSYTYTRDGYAKKKHHQSAPKDWWTEDIANLDIDLFRCVLDTVKLTNMLPPQLIGESLHVYSSLWLTRSRVPDPETSIESSNKRRQLETIISMIPEDRGSVSIGFLLKLLNLSGILKASPVIKTQLIKQSSLQLEDATPNDLLLLSSGSSDDNNNHIHDIDLVKAVVESFIMRWRRKSYSRQDLIIKVGELIDSYLQIVARDVNMPVQKVLSLAKALPEFVRPEHDNLYKAIDIYLKEHPQTSKEEKKQLCSVIDCQKLSPGVCAHVVKNERLPVRTVMQVLFFEQERSGSKATTRQDFQHSETQSKTQQHDRRKTNSVDHLKSLQLGSSDARRSKTPDSTTQKPEPESKHKSRRTKKVVEMGSQIVEEGSKLDSRKTGIQTSRSGDGHNKGRQR